MADAAQAEAYAAADFSEPNTLFLERFAASFGESFIGRVIDLGCGPGDIAIGFAQRYPKCALEALDGAAAMLAIARRKLHNQAQLADRIKLQQATLPCEQLPEKAYDAVLSNSLLHHLHDPGILWRTIRHCAKPGAAVCVMDLARPANVDAVDALVSTYAAEAPAVLRRDFRNSLYAAYRPAEVFGQLQAIGLEGCDVKMVSDRHLAIIGRCRFREDPRAAIFR